MNSNQLLNIIIVLIIQSISNHNALGQIIIEATLSEKCSEDIQNIANSKLGVFCTNGNLVGSACIFACKDGLKISGSSVLVCQRDLKWSENIPTCTEDVDDTCERKLITPENGWVLCSSSNQIGSSCLFGCNKNLQLVGEEKLTCKSDRNWNFIEPICSKRSSICDMLNENIENGYVSCTLSNAPGSVCDHFCNEGYILSGSIRLLCKIDGNWSSKPPTCVPRQEVTSCKPQLRVPQFGFMECTMGNQIDSICSFRCNEGFGTDGERFSLCQSNGSWTFPSPKCFEMRCPTRNEDLMNVKVLCTSENSIGSLCRFSCRSGYKLEGEEFSKCVGGASTKSAQWTNDVPRCVYDKSTKSTKFFPAWILCLTQTNKRKCLQKMILYCLLSKSRCL